MNQDNINTVANELTQTFLEYLEDKSILYEYREFKEHSVRIPASIKNYINFTDLLEKIESEILLKVDLFGVLHHDGTKDINPVGIRNLIQARRATNEFLSNILNKYSETQNNNMWLLNELAKDKDIVKNLVNKNYPTNPLHDELVNQLELILKKFNISNPVVLYSQLIQELDLFSKYVIYGYSLIEWHKKIEQALNLVEKLNKLNLIEEYRNIWIFVRALSENPSLTKTFSDEIFLTSRIPLNKQEAQSISNNFKLIGVTAAEDKIQISNEFMEVLKRDFVTILNMFSSNKNEAKDFLSIFNSLDNYTVESLGNFFEILRFLKHEQDCKFIIDNKLIFYKKEDVKNSISLAKLQFLINPQLSKNPNRYLEIVKSLQDIKTNDKVLNSIIERCVVSIYNLVQNAIDIFDNVHTDENINSIFSFFYNFKAFNVFLLIFYNDLTEIFNYKTSDGVDKLTKRVQNFFENYFHIINLVLNNNVEYMTLVNKHNEKLIAYIRKEVALNDTESDHFGFIRTILYWADQETGLVDIPYELIEKLETLKNNTEIYNILFEIHKTLLKAYSQMLFEFLGRGLKNLTSEEIALNYTQTIVDRFESYNKTLSYFYIIGFYFEVSNGLACISKPSRSSFEQYLKGY